jgi:hypothetical protein
VCSRWTAERREALVGASMARIVRSTVIMCSEVNGLATERAAVVDKRLRFLDSHGEVWETLVVERCLLVLGAAYVYLCARVKCIYTTMSVYMT